MSEKPSIERAEIIKLINEVCDLYEERIKKEGIQSGGWVGERGAAPSAQDLESKTEEDYREFKIQIRNICFTFKGRVLPPVK